MSQRVRANHLVILASKECAEQTVFLEPSVDIIRNWITSLLRDFGIVDSMLISVAVSDNSIVSVDLQTPPDTILIMQTS